MTTQVVFDTLAQISEGLVGTSPAIFVGSTDQTLAVITTAGAVATLYATKRIKAQDVIFINYDMDGTPGQFVATVTATSSGSLVGYTIPAGYLQTANNLSDVLSVASARTNLGIGLPFLQYTTVAITAAQFNGMYAAPKLLVAAGGANTLIIPQQVQLLMTYGAAAYAAGGVSAVQWDSTANGAGVIASTTLSAATFQATASTGFVFNAGVVPETFSTTVNKGLYLSNVTAAFTTGDSPMVAHVWYRIIPTV